MAETDFKTFKIKNNLWSFKQRYRVTDANDHEVYHGKTKTWSFTSHTTLYDAEGYEVLKIYRKLWSWKFTFFIEIDGERRFRVVRSFGFKPKIFVDAYCEEDAFYLQGDIWGSEYAFYRGDEEIAYTSKKMWSLKNVYGLAVKPGEDEEIAIAVVITLDLMRKARAAAAS